VEAVSAPRRQRPVTEILLSIVLGLEAVLVFFVTMTVFGLDLIPPAVAFGGGAALIVVLLLAGRLLMYPWGIWLGWALQAALIALGFILPALFIAGAIFVAIWVYCFVKGRSIDRRNAQLLANDPSTI